MSNDKQQTQGQFVPTFSIPRAVARLSISTDAKFLFGLMWIQFNNGDSCQLSKEVMCDELQIGIKRLNTILQELAAIGLIELPNVTAAERAKITAQGKALTYKLVVAHEALSVWAFENFGEVRLYFPGLSLNLLETVLRPVSERGQYCLDGATFMSWTTFQNHVSTEWSTLWMHMLAAGWARAHVRGGDFLEHISQFLTKYPNNWHQVLVRAYSKMNARKGQVSGEQFLREFDSFWVKAETYNNKLYSWVNKTEKKRGRPLKKGYERGTKVKKSCAKVFQDKEPMSSTGVAA